MIIFQVHIFWQTAHCCFELLFFSYFPLESLHWTVLWRLADYCRTDGSPHQILSAGFLLSCSKLKPRMVLYSEICYYLGASFSELIGTHQYPTAARKYTFWSSFVSHHSMWWGRIVINLLSPILLLDLSSLMLSCWSDLGNIRCFVLKCVEHEETINISAPLASLQQTVARCFYIWNLFFPPLFVFLISFQR